MSKIRINGETKFSKEEITKGILNVIKGRLMTIKEEKMIIEKDLEHYRKKFDLNDDEFLHKFNNGELGDDEDFFIWKGSIEIVNNLLEEEKLLREAF